MAMCTSRSHRSMYAESWQILNFALLTKQILPQYKHVRTVMSGLWGH